MAPWIPIFAITNAAYWAVFLVLAIRHRSSVVATVLGVLHLLLAAGLSVAPFRSFLDPAYSGFAIGILRLHGRSATVPAALMLGLALVSAYLLVARRSGATLWIVVAADLAFAINQLLGILVLSGDNDIQLGEYLTVRGVLAVAIMVAIFVAGPTMSAWWTAGRARQITA
jgi:hypothetical protein